MNEHNSSSLPRSRPKPGFTRPAYWAGLLVLAASLAVPLCLAWRTLGGTDLGYHLAYGRVFLDERRIVDDGEFLYTRNGPPGQAGAQPMAPGVWYDQVQGRYRFPNANYGTQIVMAAVHRWAGWEGLVALQVALAGLTLALAAGAMLRLGVAPAWAALGVVLASLAAYERFTLRPELFGYAFLAALLFVLAGHRDGWAKAVALVVLQWAYVQFHSYWFLGPALTGAFWAEAALRALWARTVLNTSPEPQVARRVKWLGLTLLAQAGIALANPWTWRLAALPFQTLYYVRAHGIAGGAGGHPWARVVEFLPTFHASYAGLWATWAFVAILVLACLGGLAALWQRRWTYMFLLAGMCLVALQMRRNMAPAAIVIVPVALAALSELARCVPLRWPAKAALPATIAAALVALALSAWIVSATAANRFYYPERRGWRFGPGLSRLEMPVDAAASLADLPRDVHVFTGFNDSSNLMYLAGREVPLLTNGWAYSPALIGITSEICADRRPLEELAGPYNIGIVVLPCDRGAAPLARKLLADAAWRLWHADPAYLVFAKAELAAQSTGDPLAADSLIAQARDMDIKPAFALHRAAGTLYRLGRIDDAIAVWRQAVREDAGYHEAWNMLGLSLARRGTGRLADQDQKGRADWDEAMQCFQTALDLRPNYASARQNRKAIQDQIDQLEKGRLIVPKRWPEE